MEFKRAAKLSSLLSKEYAEELFRLLANYRDISASEAASRLNLHINTAKDFLDGLESLDIVSKREVYEKKRPYFRYRLEALEISIRIDLSSIGKGTAKASPQWRIRESRNPNARFTVGKNNECISSVTIWSGEGREKKERKISLTTPQGEFLYHLPFPDAGFLSISEIMTRSGVDDSLLPEIQDIVELLEKHGVIESSQR